MVPGACDRQPGGAPHHLLVEDAAADAAQENQVFDRRHVDAGGEQIDGDRDRRQFFVLVAADELQRTVGGAGDLDHGVVVDRTILVLERLLEEVDHHVGVGVGGAKDEGLAGEVGIDVPGELLADHTVEALGDDQLVELAEGKGLVAVKEPEQWIGRRVLSEEEITLLAEAIVRTLSDEPLRKRLGVAARKKIRELENKLAAIMPAHVIYDNVDEKPAGYSSFWINNILRQRFNFQGVVFSDDLSMEAACVAGGYGARADAALKAGCDMALVCNHLDGAIEAANFIKGYSNPISQLRLVRMHGEQDISWSKLKQDKHWQQVSEQITALNESPEFEMDI